MAVTVKPDWESGQTSADGAELVYNIHGAASDYEAWAGLRDYSPVTYLGFFRGNFGVNRQGPNLFKGRVPYLPFGTAGSTTPVGSDPPTTSAAQSGSGAPASEDAPIDSAFTFSIASKSIHILQSRNTLYMRKPGDPLDQIGTASNYRRAIGVKPGTPGAVAGCDVFEPEFTWSKTVARRSITLAYVKQLEALVGHKNDTIFYFRDPGTTLLAGVSGRQIRGADYSLEFNFITRPNITNKIIVRDPDSHPGVEDDDPEQLPGRSPPDPLYAPQSIVVPFAHGWDHIWTLYDNVVRANQVVPQAIAVYVEEVIPFGDFGLLKI